MTDFMNNNHNWNPLICSRYGLFSTGSQDTLPPFEQLEFAPSPRKIDVLLRADELTGTIDSDLLERVAVHPRLGTLVIFGVTDAERVALMARSIMLGINMRFCESEDELQMLLHKRRSRPMLDSAASVSQSMHS